MTADADWYEPKPLVDKRGKDDDLERQANEWLSKNVGKNKRGIDRDIEKMSYESGYLARDELQKYDPDNDWDTKDSAHSIVVRPGAHITPSLCTGEDANVRARSREDPKTPAGVWGRAGEEERRKLRHLDDEDDWGYPHEDIPLLGDYDRGPRKVCTKCKRSKGTEFFYAQSRNKDGLSSWCKACQKQSIKQRRRSNSSE